MPARSLIARLKSDRPMRFVAWVEGVNPLFIRLDKDDSGDQNAGSCILLDLVRPYDLSCRYKVLGEIPRISDAFP